MSPGQIALRNLLVLIAADSFTEGFKADRIDTFFENFEVSVTAKRALADDFQPKSPETYTGI